MSGTCKGTGLHPFKGHSYGQKVLPGSIRFFHYVWPAAMCGLNHQDKLLPKRFIQVRLGDQAILVAPRPGTFREQVKNSAFVVTSSKLPGIAWEED